MMQPILIVAPASRVAKAVRRMDSLMHVNCMFLHAFSGDFAMIMTVCMAQVEYRVHTHSKRDSKANDLKPSWKSPTLQHA
jgi:uncharacterized Fe-S center protein